jgi:hypothetical protein
VPAKRSDLLWKAVTLAGGAAAAAATTRLVGLAWRRATNTETPLDRTPGSTTRGREIAWVVASGIAVALVRLVARRAFARLWRAKTGHYPGPLAEPPTTPSPIPAT